MDRAKSQRSHKLPQVYRNYIALIIFGVAFGYVEAAVVYYLRDLLNFHAGYALGSYHVLLNLGFITFVSPVHSLLLSSQITSAELFREASTIIMLLAVSYVAGKNLRQRFGAFLIIFACWDILYYVWLRVLDNWPSSLMTKDVYFLIPVTWIGPVITPIVISGLMLLSGSFLYIKKFR